MKTVTAQHANRPKSTVQDTVLNIMLYCTVNCCFFSVYMVVVVVKGLIKA